MSPSALSTLQLHALFDILTHAETYREAERFKYPNACSGFGYPFVEHGDGDTATFAARTNTPILKVLFDKIVLSLPPAKAVPLEFWSVRVQGLLTKFAEAELSESYDKGAMGTRKTLTTGVCALVEVAGRGCLGGCAGGPVENLKAKTYNTHDAQDLSRAWEDVARDVVYGNLVDELFDFAIENENIEDHSPAVRAAIDWCLVQYVSISAREVSNVSNLCSRVAGFCHQICVVSPDGPYIIKLLENAHKLVPYSPIRQALRISNAATMINGIMKLLLAKLSIGSLTNWIGFTKDADGGMNTLQR